MYKFMLLLSLVAFTYAGQEGWQPLKTGCSGTSTYQPTTVKQAEAMAAAGGSYTFDQINQYFGGFSQPITPLTFQPVVGQQYPTVNGLSGNCESAATTSCTCTINTGLGQAALYDGYVSVFNASCGPSNQAVSISIQTAYLEYDYIYQYTTWDFQWTYLQYWWCTGPCNQETGTSYPPTCVGYTEAYPFYYVQDINWSTGLGTCCINIGTGNIQASATAKPAYGISAHVFQAQLKNLYVVSCALQDGLVSCYNSKYDQSVLSYTIGNIQAPGKFQVALLQLYNQPLQLYLGSYPVNTPEWSFPGDYTTVGAQMNGSNCGPQYDDPSTINWNSADPCQWGEWHFTYCSWPYGKGNNPDYNYITSISCPNAGVNVLYDIYTGQTSSTNYPNFEDNGYNMLIRNASLSFYTASNKQFPILNMALELNNPQQTGILGYTNVLTMSLNIQQEWNAQIQTVSMTSCSGCIGCTIAFTCNLKFTQNSAYSYSFSVVPKSENPSRYLFTNTFTLTPGTNDYQLITTVYQQVSTISVTLVVGGISVATAATTDITYEAANDTQKSTDYTNGGSGVSSATEPSNTGQSSSLSWWEITLIVIGCLLVVLIIVFIIYKRCKQRKLNNMSDEEYANYKKRKEIDKEAKKAAKKATKKSSKSTTSITSL